MAKADLGLWLEQLYSRFNDRRFVPPDPLASLYRYEDVRDREIAGLLAAGLAYGNVKAICASVEKLLARLGPSPRKRSAAREYRWVDRYLEASGLSQSTIPRVSAPN